MGVAVAADGGQVPSPLAVSPAGDRSLPSLITYSWTAADSSGSSSVGLEHLCRTEGSTADPATTLPDGWIYVLTGRAVDSGDVVSVETRCVPRPDPSDPSPPSPPAAPSPPTIGEVWRTVGLPGSTFATRPPDWSVTGFESRLSAASPATEVTVAAELRGFRVEGTARLAGWWVGWGEGLPTFVDVGAAGAGGGAVPAPSARHVYERKGTYRLAVHAVWRGEVVLTSPEMAAPVPTDIGYALVATERDHRVIEIVSQLVR